MSNSEKHMDHILLPRATLMRFIDESTKKISVLNLFSSDSCSIREYKPRSFHTINNYYDKKVDAQVKKYESKIGEWNKRICDSVQNNDFTEIDFNKLKKFAIEIITLQFHRFVMVDSVLLEKFIQQKKCEYNGISLSYFRNGFRLPADFNNYLIDFRKNRHNSVRFFQRNFLMNGNEGIERMYDKFHAVILTIPEDVDASFLLPPQHFIGIDSTARVILAPKRAIGLFPDSFPDNVKYLTKDEVDTLIPRTIESALAISEIGFRQIVGNKKYLTQIKSRIDNYRSLIQNMDGNGEYKIKIQNDMLQDSLLECIIMFKTIKPDAKKITLIFPHNVKDDNALVHEWCQKFSEYQYIVTVSYEQ